MKINEDETRPVYFSHRLRTPEVHLTLNGRNISFVNHVKCLDMDIFQGARRSAICTRLSTFRIYTIITKLCRQQAEVIQNHENEHVHSIGQGEARHRKYKGLKLDGSEAYDRSRDSTAVVA
jgi:hypothetical protein